jgi:type I restriction-modification system DNA methylase subunit
VGLTNGYRFLLWQVKQSGRELKVDLDFKAIAESRKTTLSSTDLSQILFLERLKKDEIRSESKYQSFDEYYGTIDISDPVGFENLIDRLNYISNDVLRQFTYDAFDEYYAGFQEYQSKLGQIEELEKQNGKNNKTAASITELKLKLQSQFKKYASFAGFYEWRTFSNRNQKPQEENKVVFCKESIYVLLNRLLFIRICEDKGLLKKKISNGGIEQFKEFVDNPDEAYRQVLGIAYQSASGLYRHFYEKGNPLDWYETGDGELNKSLNKTLWILNRFNFSKVDKDILGKLYEKYLPRSERKKLGEFYTPDQVIDYILDSVGYRIDAPVEDKDLLDPACGSGGFLVRATRRLIARFVVKFGKATSEEAADMKNWPTIIQRLSSDECSVIIGAITDRIHGFDINPFAVHISEMNLLFQTIDLFQKVRHDDKDFQLSRFQIHRTDSLELPSNQTELIHYSNPAGQTLAQDLQEINRIKSKKFDFVVGNPPYVKTAEWHEKNLAEYYRREYKEVAFRNVDLYILFINLGIRMLNESGKLSYICSNQFMTRDYGENLRKYVTANAFIEELVDFQDNQVFDSATNYAVIFVFSKKRIEDTFMVKIHESKMDILELVSAAKTKKSTDASFETLAAKSNTFNEKAWILESRKSRGSREKIESGEPLGKYARFVSGLRIGKDALYIVREVEKGEFLSKVTLLGKSGGGTFYIENDILKEILKGSNVRRFKWISNLNYVIFPHDETSPNNTISSDDMQKRFPNAYKHFKKFESDLNKRIWFDKSAQQLHGEFYAMMYFDLQKDFSEAKIVTPALTNKPNFTLNTKGACFVGGTAGVIGIIPQVDEKILLGILNSSVFNFYLKKHCPPKRGGYNQLSVNQLSEFSLPLVMDLKFPKFKTLKDVVTKLIETNKRLDEAEGILSFSSLPADLQLQDIGNSGLVKSVSLPKKIKRVSIENNRIMLEPTGAIECNNRTTAKYLYTYFKSREKEIKKLKDSSDILKLKIPINDDDIEILVNSFDKAAERARALRPHIEKLETELDDVVFSIYDFGEEEIKLIKSV